MLENFIEDTENKINERAKLDVISEDEIKMICKYFEEEISHLKKGQGIKFLLHAESVASVDGIYFYPDEHDPFVKIVNGGISRTLKLGRRAASSLAAAYYLARVYFLHFDDEMARPVQSEISKIIKIIE